MIKGDVEIAKKIIQRVKTTTGHVASIKVSMGVSCGGAVAGRTKITLVASLPRM